MITDKNKILEYIPQRDPILMVDGMTSILENKITSLMTVKKDSIFCKNEDFVSLYGVLEHIAQSYALAHGYLYGCRIGMIGRITKLQTYLEPKIEVELNTEIEIINNMGHIVLIKAKTTQSNQDVLTCEMYLHYEN